MSKADTTNNHYLQGNPPSDPVASWALGSQAPAPGDSLASSGQVPDAAAPLASSFQSTDGSPNPQPLIESQPITYALTVAYNGAPFCGFARQPGQLTVQGELERALQTLFRRPVETVCAGRTDAGVHARGQVVSFNISPDDMQGRTFQSIQRSLNALTHDAIAVRQVAQRPAGFSARFDAQWREYRYFIYTGEAAPIFLNDFAWYIKKPLDVQAMRAGAAYLIGEHDFKSFCMAVSAVGKPTCRNVHQITVEPCEVMGEQALVITVVGNAFLHSMVRTIVGTLVMVGRGLRQPEWVGEVLAARDRTAAGENAPAKGLVFWHVEY